MTDLFPNMPTNETKLSRFKRENGIETHFNESSEPKWIALSVPKCREFIENHEGEKPSENNLVDLMIGYCVLIDEAGLLGQADIEIDACLDLSRKLNIAVTF